MVIATLERRGKTYTFFMTGGAPDPRRIEVRDGPSVEKSLEFADGYLTIGEALNILASTL